MKKRLLDWGYSCNPRVVNAAARSKNHECLIYLINNSRPYYEDKIALAAARGGNIESLKFLEQTQTGM